MLNLQQRTEAFVRLGKVMSLWGLEAEWPGFECGLTQAEFEEIPQIFPLAKQHNPWFTKENILKSLHSLGESMHEKALSEWVAAYNFDDSSAKHVGLIMAGNIPLVGFHDLMCVLLSGNKSKVKFSSDDNKLFPALISTLLRLEPGFEGWVQPVMGKLEGFDAVLATGSNNTSRYFEHYFGHVPHIIRKNRHSVAILSGNETEEDIKALAHDVFDYFGLGCRNISKLYLPNGYEFDNLFKPMYEFSEVINHHKYANNYDYNKAVWLLNNEDLLDNGFILLRQSPDMTSPTGSLHYEYYDDVNAVHQQIEELKEEIQCVVGEGFLPFGKSQAPCLTDYADGVDTMKWLEEL